MAVTFPRLPRWLCRGGNKDREKDSISKGSSYCSLNRKKMRKIGNVLFPKPDEPEWSIGWVEPHGPGFKTTEDEDEDGDNGFVVLVPCYKKANDGLGNQILGVINNLPNGLSPDGRNMEQWLSSMGKL